MKSRGERRDIGRERRRNRWMMGLLVLALVGVCAQMYWSKDDPTPRELANGRGPAESRKPRVSRKVHLTLTPTPTIPPEPVVFAAPVVPLDMPTPFAAFDESAQEEEREVTISVVDSKGNPIPGAIVESEDCGLYRRAMGGFVVIITTEDACTFQAGRRDGALMAFSDPVFVELEPGESTALTLNIASERTAGMGLQVAQDDRGILVARVIPGSPAEKAGVQDWDLITQIDGIQTAGLTVREFIELGTGPVGTRVSLALERRTETSVAGMELSFIRGFIDRIEE